MLLWSGQLLPGMGSSMSNLAIHLIVVAMTGSPFLVGAAVSIRVIVRMAGQLPSEALVDQVNRRRLILTADGVRAIAFVILGLCVLFGNLSFSLIATICVTDAIGSAVFDCAELLRSETWAPLDQMPDAVAGNQAPWLSSE